MTTEIEIRPSHIRTDDQRAWMDTFAHFETEVSARWVVRFCQERDDTWRPFTMDEIEEWASAGSHGQGFTLNRLVRAGGYGALIEHADGIIEITDRFIRRCFGAAGKFKAVRS